MHPNKKRFAELFTASTWTQAKVTRELRLTSSAISQFLDPESRARPSDAILKLFEMLVSGPFEPMRGTKQTGVINEGAALMEPDETEMLLEMRRLEPTAKARVISAVRQMVEIVPKRKVRY